MQLAPSRRPGTDVLGAVPGLRPAEPSASAPVDAGELGIAPDAAVSDEDFWSGPEAAARAAQKIDHRGAGGTSAASPSGQTPAISTIPPINGPGNFSGPVREPRDRRWPRRVIVAIVALALAAASIAIVWKVSQTSEKNRIKAEKTLANTSTSTKPTPGTADTEVEATTTTVLNVAKAGFSATCPTPGAGWSLRPVWPGDQDNLAWYDFSFEQFDTTFQQFATMTAPEFTQYTPTKVPSGNARTIRIQAVFKDSTVSDPVITVWTAPTDPC